MLGEVRLLDLTPEQIGSWRLTVPEGHRYEATQALRQVLSRAVAWGLLDYNPAKRGVPNPIRRAEEKRPFESWQDRLQPDGPPVPGPRGNHIDLRNFRRRYWKPAVIAAGIEPFHQPYDRRHTYATFALRAGVPVFAVSRFMGTSIAMIDIHYGHLAHDGREHAVTLLDNLAAERAVDARWTLDAVLAKRLRSAQSRPRRVVLTTPGGRLVDGAQKSRHHTT